MSLFSTLFSQRAPPPPPTVPTAPPCYSLTHVEPSTWIWDLLPDLLIEICMQLTVADVVVLTTALSKRAIEEETVRSPQSSGSIIFLTPTALATLEALLFGALSSEDALRPAFLHPGEAEDGGTLRLPIARSSPLIPFLEANDCSLAQAQEWAVKQLTENTLSIDAIRTALKKEVLLT